MAGHDRRFLSYREIRKIRLWCNLKNDHGGAVPFVSAKLRMEFWPDELAKMGLLDEALGECDDYDGAEESVAAEPELPVEDTCTR